MTSARRSGINFTEPQSVIEPDYWKIFFFTHSWKQEQHSPKRLLVLIVDAARLATGKQPSQDQLINFTYDWQLEDIPVLDDPDSTVAGSYVVKSTPATFLIGADGTIQQRWDGFASASQLALSIDALLGAPAQRQIDTSESTATP